MTLEERYKASSENTYVGRVRSKQAAIGPDGKDLTGVTRGVDFLDGKPKSAPTAPDQVQDEFTRNNSGDFRYDGGGKIPGANAGDPKTQYKLSRWLTKGIEKGDSYMTDIRFTTVSDIRNGTNNLIYKYSALIGKKFAGGASEVGVNTSANARIKAGATSTSV